MENKQKYLKYGTVLYLLIRFVCCFISMIADTFLTNGMMLFQKECLLFAQSNDNVLTNLLIYLCCIVATFILIFTAYVILANKDQIAKIMYAILMIIFFVDCLLFIKMISDIQGSANGAEIEVTMSFVGLGLMWLNMRNLLGKKQDVQNVK